MIRIWRGFHSKPLFDLLKASLKSNDLLILLAPTHRDFSFIPLLPSGPVELVGDWQSLNTEDLSQVRAQIQLPRQQKYPENPVLGVFTSGTSSGHPRLVLYSRKNLEASLNSIRQLFDTERIQKIFCFPQPTHIFGLALGYVQAALHNCELIFAEGKYSHAAQRLWFQCTDENTLTLGAPAHFLDLLSTAKMEELKAPISYASICGGAPITQKLWADQQQLLNIQNPSVGYGASEASPGVTHLPPGVAPSEDSDIGQPLPGVEVQTLPGQGLAFKGANVCLAFIENQILSFPDKILLSDWVETNKDGRLIFKGRYSSVINRGGQKLPLENIENYVRSLTGSECLAVGVPDPRLEEELGLLIQSQNFDANQIKAALKSEFGFSTAGVVIKSAQTLPMNSNHKPDRQAAKRLLCCPDLPAKVQSLEAWLPHRAPAIWVDSVLSADEKGGVCEVGFDSSKNYCSSLALRVSSPIEWMAQSYAFVKAYQSLASLSPERQKPKKAYLVAVRNYEVLPAFYEPSDRFEVQVRQTHQLGPLMIVEGEVSNHEGKKIARGELKVFAE